jgi:hypothetical protein
MIEPTRKEHPHKFLDASLVPLERALHERAEKLTEAGKASTSDMDAFVRLLLANELNAIAEELHFW